MKRNQLDSLPLSRRTTLSFRNTDLDGTIRSAGCLVRNLILDRCDIFSIFGFLSGFPDLEVFVACELSVPGQEPGFDWVPRSVRHIHILQRNSIYVDSHRPALPATFPVLESLTFTWLQPSEFGIPDVDIANPLPDLRRFVESSVVAPRCTFRFLRSSKLSKDALADQWRIWDSHRSIFGL